MQATGLRPVSGTSANADVCQVLDGYCGSLGATGDNTLRDDMIAVAAETGLTTPQGSKMPLGGSRSSFLQGTLESEGAGLDVPPPSLPQKPTVTRDSRLDQAEVDAKNFFRVSDFGRLDVNDDVEVPAALVMNQVRSGRLGPVETVSVLGQAERNRLPALHGRKPDRPMFPIELEGVNIETRRTHHRSRLADLPTLLRQSEDGSDCLGGLDTSLTVQIGHQGGIGSLQLPVGPVMKGDAILLLGEPTDLTDGVKGGCELFGGRSKDLPLFGCWDQQEFDCPVHGRKIPYVGRKCKGGNSSRYLKATAPCDTMGPGPV